MKTPVGVVLLVALCGAPSPVQKTPNPSAIAVDLRSVDLAVKAAAISIVNQSDALVKDPLIRSAILDELSRGTRLRVEARHSKEPAAEKSQLYAAFPGNVLMAFIRAACKLEGPDVLAALVEHVGTGPTVEKRLSRFGAIAVEPVLMAARSGKGAHSAEMTRFGAQRALARLVVAGVVTVRQRPDLEGLARVNIRSAEANTAAGAIFLGVALGLPDILGEASLLRDGRAGYLTRQSGDPRLLVSSATKALSGVW